MNWQRRNFKILNIFSEKCIELSLRKIRNIILCLYLFYRSCLRFISLLFFI